MKNQIIDLKVYFSSCKGKALLGDVNKLFVFKSLLTTPSNVLPSHLKETFKSVIWIFTEGEGDGIESRLPFKFFYTEQILIFKNFWPMRTTSTSLTCLLVILFCQKQLDYFKNIKIAVKLNELRI